jgi:hypothetical protein
MTTAYLNGVRGFRNGHISQELEFRVRDYIQITTVEGEMGVAGLAR